MPDHGAPALAALVDEAARTWDPAVERAIFGSSEPATVAGELCRFVGERLAPVSGAVFYRPGVGVVAGVRLVDGAEVVVKVHRWNVSIDRLRAVQRVQAHLAAAGLPAPRPLVPAEPLGHGIATVEELVTGGPVDAHDPAVRTALAAGLHRFVVGAADLADLGQLGTPLLLRPAGAPLWWEPHDLRFDFEATAAGAEWIDEQATVARRRLDDAALGAAVVGHFDWRVQNLAFDGARIVAVYDWDSLGIAPEPVVVGNAAAQFCVDWSLGDPDPLPTLADMRSFVADYEAASGRPFTPPEREVLDAANLMLCAYGARCQHSDRSLELGVVAPSGGAWMRLLHERGDDGLLV